MGKIIGIDLGTTNSAFAYMVAGKPEVIANAEGNRTTPSVVAINKNGERLVGQVAQRQRVTNAKNTIYGVKRLIGRKFSDDEVQKDHDIMPYEIVKKGDGVAVKMGDKEYTPEEVSAMILSKIKADAEAFLGEKVTEAVITVPAYFDDSQRQATKDAGKIAGLEVKRIINEPTAAALAYGLDSKKDEAEKAKKELSSTTEYEINLPFITADADGPKHFEYKLTRSKLEDLVKDLIDRLAGPVEKALKDADMKASDVNEIVLVGGMTRMPAVVEKVKAIFGKDPLKGVNPDEVVAVGAAIQGGVLQGDVKDVLLLDVTPLSLGIETMGGVTTKLIERNSTIPTSKSETFSTAADNQPQVEIHVLQGEREMSADNKSLGRFILDGIAPAPRGVPQIEVTFSLDANGILNVTAKDKGTGKENSVTIQDSGNMSKEDIEKAQKEAEAHADEDKKKREAVDARNTLENAIYQAEKMPDEYKDKISDDDKKVITDAVEEAKKHKDSNEKDELETAAKELMEKIQTIGAKLYETAAKEEKPEEKADDKKGDEPVEGEVVDEDKK